MHNTDLPLGITVHSVIRNEPLIYKAIMAVYKYVDKILIYDTGSDDTITLQLIEQLIREDYDNKITFKQVEIDFEEWKWNTSNINSVIDNNRGKKGVGYWRKKQIEDTTTSHFLIVDGDEVHYEQSIKAIRNAVDNWDYDKICGFCHLIWLADMEGNIFNCYSPVGRIFLTEYVGMTDISPNEMHTNLMTDQAITKSDWTSFVVNDSIFAHFEHPLKPWRRNVLTITGKIELPEVFYK